MASSDNIVIIRACYSQFSIVLLQIVERRAGSHNQDVIILHYNVNMIIKWKSVITALNEPRMFVFYRQKCNIY